MVRVALARVGVFAFAFAVSVPFAGFVHPRESQSVAIASSSEAEGVAAHARSALRVREVARSEVVAGLEAPTPEAAAPTPPPPPPPPPTLAPPPTSGVVVASWYGPGFYGNRTACGQTYTPEIVGVAHRTLPCGTPVTIEFRGRELTVPVIDRGPFVAGRTLDLSNATRALLGCTDLCTVSMRVRS